MHHQIIFLLSLSNGRSLFYDLSGLQGNILGTFDISLRLFNCGHPILQSLYRLSLRPVGVRLSSLIAKIFNNGIPLHSELYK